MATFFFHRSATELVFGATFFFTGFISLLATRAHNSPPPFSRVTNSISLILNAFRNDFEIKCKTLNNLFFGVDQRFGVSSWPGGEGLEVAQPLVAILDGGGLPLGGLTVHGELQAALGLVQRLRLDRVLELDRALRVRRK
jgi:hypothetical protein